MVDSPPLEGYRIPASHQSAVDAALRTAVDDRWATRIWERDTTVWTDDVRGRQRRSRHGSAGSTRRPTSGP